MRTTVLIFPIVVWAVFAAATIKEAEAQEATDRAITGENHCLLSDIFFPSYAELICLYHLCVSLL